MALGCHLLHSQLLLLRGHLLPSIIWMLLLIQYLLGWNLLANQLIMLSALCSLLDTLRNLISAHC